METSDSYSMLNDPEMKEILDSFLVETKEILEKLDIDLVEMENRPDDTELLNQVFRSFHTIKGTSGFLGLNKLTLITHRCEDILNKLRKKESKINTSVMDAVLNSFDKIKELVSSVEFNFNEDIDITNSIDVLNKVIEDMNKTCIKVNDENSSEEGRKAKDINSRGKIIGEPQQTELIPKNQEETFIPEPAKEDSGSKKISREENSIRVDIERLDELLNIASELVLGRNRLTQVYSEFAHEFEGTKLDKDLSEAAKQIDLMTNELQLLVMKTRMVKIGKVFTRFPRLIRDLSKEAGKKIKLILKGEDTELDKTLIEEINDPLVHLVRNSIDHGIEPPDERKANGKNPVGTIILSAEQEGNNIIINVSDDGGGINPEVIKEKAISKGLISEEKAKELTKQDILNLIFLPGFSTAKVVTNISGRGVGMDVVKTNVAKLRGIINIDSEVGIGTTINIRLPLTLAIIPGMIVEINEETIVIPLNSVIEVVRVHSDNIKSINEKEVIMMRDSIIPIFEISRMIYRKENYRNKIWQHVVVVGIAEKKFGIKVDKLIGQKEVVIKSLGNYLGTIEGIAGSTILGDGTVVMILDINEILNQIEKVEIEKQD
jgi:two-component system, chemotaxis family, sensor kinase CheA